MDLQNDSTAPDRGEAVVYKRIVRAWLNNIYDRDLKALLEKVDACGDVRALEEIQAAFQESKDFVTRRTKIEEILDRGKDA